jgi:N-acetylglutamate synthase-like GNAT family acetyltransferase
MQVRKAFPEEYDDIYQMGFDVWGEEQPIEVYLDECRRSTKYQRGCWYVLVDGNGTIFSSLIRYSLATDACGIGSIATPPFLRNKGHASRLITYVLNLFESEGIQKTFLFSDIDSKFYEKFGFFALPRPYQHYESAVCMVRGIKTKDIEQDSRFQPPKYF